MLVFFPVLGGKDECQLLRVILQLVTQIVSDSLKRSWEDNNTQPCCVRYKSRDGQMDGYQIDLLLVFALTLPQ